MVCLWLTGTGLLQSHYAFHSKLYLYRRRTYLHIRRLCVIQLDILPMGWNDPVMYAYGMKRNIRAIYVSGLETRYYIEAPHNVCAPQYLGASCINILRRSLIFIILHLRESMPLSHDLLNKFTGPYLLRLCFCVYFTVKN